MPSLIENYVQSLLNAAVDSPVVSSSSIVSNKRTNRTGIVRGDLYIIDGSLLNFRELVEIQETVIQLMYSYHYQKSSKQMLFRYDDTTFG
jgi:hypothetical protein